MKLRRKCQGNYAEIGRMRLARFRFNTDYMSLYPLTVPACWSIMRHKYTYTYARPPHQRQTPGPPGLRHLQPTPCPGAPSALSRIGLFRSPRPAPTQIRKFAGPPSGPVLPGSGCQRVEGDQPMFRDIILWLAGVPIVVIILLHLIGALH